MIERSTGVVELSRDNEAPPDGLKLTFFEVVFAGKSSDILEFGRDASLQLPRESFTLIDRAGMSNGPFAAQRFDVERFCQKMVAKEMLITIITSNTLSHNKTIKSAGAMQDELTMNRPMNVIRHARNIPIM
jgi:hypothetical protein